MTRWTSAGKSKHMVLYLKEKDVGGLLTMDDAIAALREGFELQAAGDATVLPRRRLKSSKGGLYILPSTADGLNIAGLKTYYGNSAGWYYMVILFSTEDARPVAVIEASRMGQLRTGAASAIATDLLSRRSASTLGCIGSGYQAETQVEAICRVRDIDRVIIYSRGKSQREDFARRVEERLRKRAVAVDSTDTMKEADILVTATSSKSAVIGDEQIASDCHINAIGGNWRDAAELEARTVSSAKTVVADCREQAETESGDIMGAVEKGLLSLEDVNELWQGFRGGFRPNRHATTGRTLFKSLGVGLEDVSVGALVYRKAVERGIGTDV